MSGSPSPTLESHTFASVHTSILYEPRMPPLSTSTAFASTSQSAFQDIRAREHVSAAAAPARGSGECIYSVDASPAQFTSTSLAAGSRVRLLEELAHARRAARVLLLYCSFELHELGSCAVVPFALKKV